MAHDVYWMIENHVIYTKYTGEITLDDIRGSTQMIADLLEGAYANAPHNTIIGVVDTHEGVLTSMLRAAVSMVVQQVADVIDKRVWKAKPGFTVLITTNQHAKMIIALLVRLANNPMTTVETLDEALMVIGTMYPELADQIEALNDTPNAS